MDPMTLSLIGGGVGLLKGARDEKAAERDRKLQAQTALYSPWTGMKPQSVKEADPSGSIMQGALTGAQFGQNMQSADMQNQFQKQMLQNMQNQNFINQMGPAQMNTQSGIDYKFQKSPWTLYQDKADSMNA